MGEPADSRSAEYAARLERLGAARWRRWLDVQAPYRWQLRRLGLGRTLDLGCGIGRHLVHLPAGSVGIDPNPHAVAAARRRGCEAYGPEEFRASPRARETFDTLLVAHVLEHLPEGEAAPLLAAHLRFLHPGARVLLVTPQEAGFRSDPSHRTFLDFDALRELLDALGCAAERAFSFPLPRGFGRVFPHNEFVVVGRLP